MGVVTIPAPFNGINQKDSAHSLAPNFALTLENLIPGPGYVSTRGPTTQANAGVGTNINSIDGNANGTIVLGTTGGAIWQMGGGAALATGFTGVAWHGTLFQDRTILTNGSDTPQIYNGTTITAGVYSGSGLTPSNLYAGLTFKGRVYYWEAAGRFFWYAAAGAFQGALSKYDVSTFCRTNGYVVSMCPMTLDGGNGPDDMLAILFSTGEVLLFQGDDPGSATSWQMIGSYLIGEMLGRRCWAIVGSATIVATKNGPVDLAKALQLGPSDTSAAVGTALVNTWPPNCVYTTLVHDPRNRILWYITSEGYDEGIYSVYGMDVDSRGWFQVIGISSATTYAVGYSGSRVMYSKGQVIYFGPDRDHDGSTGDAMNGSSPVAYSLSYGYLDFGAPQAIKRVKSVRINAQRGGGTDTGAVAAVTFQEPNKTTQDGVTTYGTMIDPAPRNMSASGRQLRIALSYTGYGPWTIYGLDLDVEAIGTR